MTSLTFPGRISIFENTTIPWPRPAVDDAFEWISRWIWIDEAEQPIPESQRIAREIQRFTNWSDRNLALALGTSHPTVGKILSGRSVNLPLQERLVDLHALIERVHILAGRDVSATARALGTNSSNNSAFRLVTQNNVSAAYLAAVDALKNRPFAYVEGR